MKRKLTYKQKGGDLPVLPNSLLGNKRRDTAESTSKVSVNPALIPKQRQLPVYKDKNNTEVLKTLSEQLADYGNKDLDLNNKTRREDLMDLYPATKREADFVRGHIPKDEQKLRDDNVREAASISKQARESTNRDRFEGFPIDSVLYMTNYKLLKENNNPDLHYDFQNEWPRSHYDGINNTLHLQGSDDLTAELAHAQQQMKQPVIAKAAEDWVANPYFTSSGYKKQYDRKGTLENEAHSIIEPVLDKRRNAIYDSIQQRMLNHLPYYAKGGDVKSVKGYSKGSPYRGNPYIDIKSPQGLIDMSNTDIPLYAVDETGHAKVLPPYSGMHQFPGSTVREIPIAQEGGSMNPYQFLFGEDEEEGVSEESTPAALPDDTDATRALSEQRRLSDEEENNYALQIAMEQFPELRRGNPYRNAPEDGEAAAVPGAYDFSAVGNSLGKKDVNSNAKYAFSYLQKKGLAPHVAAGIVGNLMQESGLNPTVKGDNGQAMGIAQWHPDRQAGLFQFAKGKNPYALDTQLDYLLHEAGQRGDLQRLSQAKTSEEAAYLFAKNYERPKTIEPIRGQYARSLYP